MSKEWSQDPRSDARLAVELLAELARKYPVVLYETLDRLSPEDLRQLDALIDYVEKHFPETADPTD